MPIFPRYAGPLLMEQVCQVENLTLAWRRVRSNIQVARRGRSAGPDAVTLRDFEADWTRQMTQLADQLRSGAYRAVPTERPGAVYLDAAGRALLVDRYEAILQHKTRAPTGEQITLRQVLLLQARAMARVMRGEQAHYMGFTL